MELRAGMWYNGGGKIGGYVIEIEGLYFDWDTDKNISNIEKHGVPFKEAATVFRDNAAIILDDLGHSEAEERFKIIGFSGNLRLLIVCHCYRDDDSVIRIISARKATQQEQIQYRGSL
ncbi:MAG: BrnT family toxin [Peptococcaceae bacterium]|nr:BrnT family toxin [Peptococcaceae bacterium]